jgi:hypothetical protein
MTSSAVTDRRVYRRISAPARAQLIQPDGGRLELPVRDVSVGGIFLFTSVLPAPIGTQVSLEVHLPQSTYVVRLDAEIVRSVEDPPGKLLGIGLRFADPTPEQRVQLDGLMLRLLEGPGGERRAYPRVSHRVAVRCDAAPSVAVILRDLSHGGAGLWVDAPIPFGSTVSLEISRDTKPPLVVSGLVVAPPSARPGEPYGQVGIRFEGLSPEGQSELDAFLEDLVRQS